MPLCTMHLLTLNAPLPTFLKALSSAFASSSPDQKPLITSRVIRWVITPERLAVDRLLPQSTHWDILLILPGTASLPTNLASTVKDQYTLTAGIPSKLLQGFHDRNQRLLHPASGDVPLLTGALDSPLKASSAQNLEFTDDLATWLGAWDPQNKKGAVSMLNLLAFKPSMHATYLKYGSAFADSIGSKRGGSAKIVGKVTGGGSDDKGDGWEEIALAHYPSIRHFADMAASRDYQEVNQRYRVPSLRDTCILCTSELEWDGRESKL